APAGAAGGVAGQLNVGERAAGAGVLVDAAAGGAAAGRAAGATVLPAVEDQTGGVRGLGDPTTAGRAATGHVHGGTAAAAGGVGSRDDVSTAGRAAARTRRAGRMVGVSRTKRSGAAAGGGAAAA